MQLSDTTGLDLNRLPYFVTDGDGNRVLVAFTPIREADKSELSGEDWTGAAFRDAWLQYAENNASHTVKLVTVGEAARIVGMLQIGSVIDGLGALKNSLLETAPVYRYQVGSTPSSIRGVGRALVARLAVESYNRGAGGAVRVRARSEATDFYPHIGFIVVNPIRRTYRLTPDSAAALFEKVTF